MTAAVPAASTAERSPVELSWRRSVGVLAGRNAKRLLRSPVTLVQSVFFPTLLLLTLLAAFGRVIGGSVSDYATRMVPQLVIAAGAFGAAGTGIAVHMDREAGMIDRLRSLPIDRRAYLAAAVAADALRATAAAAVLAVIGHVFGFRFHQGVAAMAAFFVVAAAFSTIWGWLAVRVGLVAQASEAVGSAMNGPVLMLFFLSSGFVPVEGFPGWLQPVVRANPLSVAVETLIGLSAGGEVLVPALQTAAWIAALTAVLAPSAVRRYRTLTR